MKAVDEDDRPPDVNVGATDGDDWACAAMAIKTIAVYAPAAYGCTKRTGQKYTAKWTAESVATCVTRLRYIPMTYIHAMLRSENVMYRAMRIGRGSGVDMWQNANAAT